MRKAALAICVCGLVLFGANRAQGWTEDFETDLSHWTLSLRRGNGTMALEDGKLRLQAIDGSGLHRAVVRAEYPMAWPAEGEAAALTFSGARSPGTNAYSHFGAHPARFIYNGLST